MNLPPIGSPESPQDISSLLQNQKALRQVVQRDQQLLNLFGYATTALGESSDSDTHLAKKLRDQKEVVPVLASEIEQIAAKLEGGRRKKAGGLYKGDAQTARRELAALVKKVSAEQLACETQLEKVEGALTKLTVHPANVQFAQPSAELLAARKEQAERWRLAQQAKEPQGVQGPPEEGRVSRKRKVGAGGESDQLEATTRAAELAEAKKATASSLAGPKDDRLEERQDHAVRKLEQSDASSQVVDYQKRQQERYYGLANTVRRVSTLARSTAGRMGSAARSATVASGRVMYAAARSRPIQYAAAAAWILAHNWQVYSTELLTAANPIEAGIVVSSSVALHLLKSSLFIEGGRRSVGYIWPSDPRVA